MLFLTGAQTSLTSSGGQAPNLDPAQSLGGYISSTPVPNGQLNALFDDISLYTINQRQKETIAIALVNDSKDQVINGLYVKTVVAKDNQAKWRVAVTQVNIKNATMEAITNRYAEPIGATFEDVEFVRANVDVKIVVPAEKGSTVVFYPFNVEVEMDDSSVDGNWEAIKDAFSDSQLYRAKRLSNNEFRIELRANDVVETPQDCSFITDGNAKFEFLGKFQNDKTNEGYLVETFNPGDMLGIWLQRIPKRKVLRTNEQIIEDEKNGVVIRTKEHVQLVFTGSEQENELSEEIEGQT
jgi:hypothetical protein